GHDRVPGPPGRYPLGHRSPAWRHRRGAEERERPGQPAHRRRADTRPALAVSRSSRFELQGAADPAALSCWCLSVPPWIDRKSTRLNSSHVKISYAVSCLKRKRSIELVI